MKSVPLCPTSVSLGEELATPLLFTVNDADNDVLGFLQRLARQLFHIDAYGIDACGRRHVDTETLSERRPELSSREPHGGRSIRREQTNCE